VEVVKVTIDVNDLRVRLRNAADQAARRAKEYRAEGNTEEADFYSGRQAGFVAALGMLSALQNAAAQERDAALTADEFSPGGCRHEERALDGRCAYCSRTDDGHDDWADEERAEEEDAMRGDYGQGVNIAALERLEEFARSAGGAVDMASGTVYSDADGGL
jgi:hypothetical protein